MSSGDANICTIESSSGTNILVGQTASASAGTTIGVLSTLSLAGSHVYTLTGTLTATDTLGRAITTPTITTPVNIEVIRISITVQMTNMFYRAGEPAVVETFASFTQSSSGGSIPTYTYSYELQDWNGGTPAASTASRVSVNSATR